MKPIFRYGVLAIALIVASGSLQAQQPSLPAVKIGFVNMGLLATKHKKAEALKNEIEAELEPLKKETERLKKIMQGHADYLNSKVKEPAQVEISRKAMNDGQRALEDLDFVANRSAKKREAQLVALHKELHAIVQAYAEQNGYHIIMAYSEPLNQDLLAPMNIGRKLMAFDAGGSVPFYVQSDLDITNALLAR